MSVGFVCSRSVWMFLLVMKTFVSRKVISWDDHWLVNLDGGVVIVEVLNEGFEVELAMCPDHEYVINKSPPYEWLQGLGGTEVSL